MKKIGLAMALVFGFGCGGGSKLDGILKELESYKSKACACPDKACTDKVKADYDKWKETAQKSLSKDDMKNMTKEQDQKFDDVEDAMKVCFKKYDAPEGGAGAPPAPTP